MIEIFLPLFLVPALPAAPGAGPRATQMARQITGLDRRVLAMGTELALHLEGPGDLAAAAERALAEGVRIEAACSTWNPGTPWSRLGAAQGRPMVLEREWLDLLQVAADWSRRTGGAFDPVLQTLVQAWGLREGGRVPSEEALAQARAASGVALLELDLAGGTARLRHPGAGLEEGGFLKGHALDRMRLAAGTPSGLLDFGGQLLAWGVPAPVAVADPRERKVPRLTLELKNASLACSGTSERGRHLLDPRSGTPCPAWGSVAVVAPEALAADILATALYVMGPQAGPAWAEQHGVAAAFLFSGGRIVLTRPFQALHPTPTEHP